MLIRCKILHVLSGVFIWLSEKIKGKVGNKLALLACKCLDKELEMVCNLLFKD